MRRIWRRYLHLLDQDLSTKVFDNLKNLIVCALLFAAGTNALRHGQAVFLGVFPSNTTGWGLIVLSSVLMLLNISDGVRRLSKLKYHIALQILIVAIYVLVAERVVEIVWNFRA